MQIIKSKAVSVQVPAGKYVLGDPCYSVPDEHWDALLASCEYFNEPVGTVNGVKVLAFSTKWGDGCYQDQFENEYGVDAGLIGLVPIALATKGDSTYTTIVEFSTPTVCSTNGEGKLTFGKYVIDTDPEEGEEW
jgi:hypothetical protein